MSTIPELRRNRGYLLNPLEHGFRPERLRQEATSNSSQRIDTQIAKQDDGGIRAINFPMRVPVEISADD